MTEVELDRRDLMSILHDQWRSTNSLLEAQLRILGYLGPDPFSETDAFDEEQIREIFAAPIRRLERALDKTIMHVGSELTARRIPASSWERLRGAFEELEHSKATGSAILPFRLRELVVSIRNELDLLKAQRPSPGLNRDQVREILSATGEVERMVAIYDLRRAIHLTKLTNERVYSVLQSNNEGAFGAGVKGGHLIDDVVREVVAHFGDQAKLRGIKIEINEYSGGTAVMAPKSDLAKALGNLLDNAIKYTGELPPNSKYTNTWIEIRVIRGSESVSVRVESWGLPITDEEKKGGFVFKAGYRGWFARQSGIEGTGTGLADVEAFALKHGGHVSFDSLPVRKTAKTTPYTTTTVTLTLPLANS
jgi:signal transduction histidine kinase